MAQKWSPLHRDARLRSPSLATFWMLFLPLRCWISILGAGGGLREALSVTTPDDVKRKVAVPTAAEPARAHARTRGEAQAIFDRCRLLLAVDGRVGAKRSAELACEVLCQFEAGLAVGRARALLAVCFDDDFLNLSACVRHRYRQDRLACKRDPDRKFIAPVAARPYWKRGCIEQSGTNGCGLEFGAEQQGFNARGLQRGRGSGCQALRPAAARQHRP